MFKEEHQQMVSQEEDNQRRLEMNIVNSPDRIIGELEAMEADLANTRHKHDLAMWVKLWNVKSSFIKLVRA